MFSLDRKLASSTCVVERPGKIKSPNSMSPRPTRSRNSFHPFLRPLLPPPPTNRTIKSPPPDRHSPLTSSAPQISNASSRTIRSRKPQTGRSITHNEFRPHVPTANRISSWRTPFGSRHHAAVARTLPPPLLESALMAVRGALAPNTESTYGAGPLRFTQFCDKWEISEEARMPADYALLCAFIGEFKGLQSGNTIRSWLAGLRSWHIMNHAPWYASDDEWVHLACISADLSTPLCGPSPS